MRDGHPVTRSYLGDMVRCFAPTATRHIFKNDGGITRDIFLQEWSYSSRAQVSRAARLPTLDDDEGLAFINLVL